MCLVLTPAVDCDVVIIKEIYIAQVRKGHKCAMSAEMAVCYVKAHTHGVTCTLFLLTFDCLLLQQQHFVKRTIKIGSYVSESQRNKLVTISGKGGEGR